MHDRGCRLKGASTEKVFWPKNVEWALNSGEIRVFAGQRSTLVRLAIPMVQTPDGRLKECFTHCQFARRPLTISAIR